MPWTYIHPCGALHSTMAQWAHAAYQGIHLWAHSQRDTLSQYYRGDPHMGTHLIGKEVKLKSHHVPIMSPMGHTA